VSKPEPSKSVAADAPPAAVKPPVVVTAAAARLELLGGDEITQLTLKPSLWFIPLVSLRWVATMAVIALALAWAMQSGWTAQGLLAFQAACSIAAIRVGIGTLQWASHLYVLTNQRVLCFAGVLNVRVAACPLARVAEAELRSELYQRWLRLGTITLRPAPAPAPAASTSAFVASEPSSAVAQTAPRAATLTDATTVRWEHLAHAADVHEAVLKAIRKAQCDRRP
jgi:membrane protein YdbS with pleckstrin-like domain